MKTEDKTDGMSDRPNAEGIRKGRFQARMDEDFARFNASINFDKRLYTEDIEGSIAHARMLGRQGIISQKEASTIVEGLQRVLQDFHTGHIQLLDELEDIHMNIEHALHEKIGDVAGKLHTARSRNDQVALDLRMYLMKKTDRIKDLLHSLMATLVAMARDSQDLIMPGYTHLQRAQPVRLAHHLLAYFEMFRRDWLRFSDCRNRTDSLPLGSAALAGTTFNIDREYVAKELGFRHVSVNSMDSVSDRDFVAEFIFDCSMVMMHLSRLSEELIIWSSEEFGFCVLPDELCSGSSIMPQKKNPDACELVRGKTGRVYGDLVAILSTLKALPLTYNKDLQEDKEPLFDSVDTAVGSLVVMTKLIQGIHFNESRMLDAASEPHLAATDLADRLTREGVPFREAHERIGTMIRSSMDSRADRKEDVTNLPTPEEMVEARYHVGGTARSRILDQIERATEFLQNLDR
jgi:argininosuccinate lyase